jgi:hypothetical protein
LKDNNARAAAESVDRALRLEPNNAAARSLQRVIAARLAQNGSAPQ